MDRIIRWMVAALALPGASWLLAVELVRTGTIVENSPAHLVLVLPIALVAIVIAIVCVVLTLLLAWALTQPSKQR